MKRIFLLMSLFAFVCLANAQTQSTITGKVKDAATGEFLMGVNVRVDGTTTGTSTGLDGDYSIKVSDNATLIFSYMGYETQKIKLNGQKVLNVALGEKTELMDEVVVVGYTSMKRRDVLGAVSKIDSKSINALPVSSTAQALQGRIAGVQVSNATGAPGAGVSVRVRGVGSISSSNDPLYIVDGIPVEDALNSISPGDIENISVLKDASSAAIYGSRANNGVVLITTKTGKKGKAQITYHGQFGFQTHANLIEMANTAEYIDIYNQAVDADNAGSSIKRTRLAGDYLNGLADVDHVASIFQTAPIYSQELSVSGGNDKTNYMISGTYFNQEGIIRNSGYNRATLRANINSDVKNWLKVGFNMSGSLGNTRSVSSSGDGYGNSEGGSVVRYAMFRNPAIPIKDGAGQYIDKPSTYFGNSIYDTFFGDGYNPVALAENTDRKKTEEGLFSRIYATFKLPFNLSWTNNFGIDYKNYKYKVYNASWGDDNRINNPNSVTVDHSRNLGWTFNTLLNWNKTFNEVHNLSVMAGFEAIRSTGESMSNSDQDFPVWNKDVLYIGGGTGEKVSKESEYSSTLASFFGQASYDYRSRYYVSGTIRRDGSSKFVGDNRWGTFYSASAGWNIEQEAFMQDVTVINKLKLRAGYGSIGNQNIGNYAYSDIYSSNYNYPFGGTSVSGYAQTKLGNPNLKWETSNQFNVGLDLELLKGSFAFSVDFYNKITKDMLVQAPLPPSIGDAEPYWINNGKVLNRGVDLEFMYRKDYKECSYIGFEFDVTPYQYVSIAEIEAFEQTKEAIPVSGPIAIKSGFNADAIAEAKPSKDYSTMALDDQGWVLFSAAVQEEGSIPNDGVVISNSGMKYQFSDFTANNAAIMKTNGATATLEFVSPQLGVEKLYLLTISANGASKMEVKANYSDGTSSEAQTFTVDDWFNTSSGLGEAVYGLSRIIRESSGYEFNADDIDERLQFRLFEQVLPVDDTKSVVSVTVTSKKSGSYPTVFAVSKEGKYVDTGLKEPTTGNVELKVYPNPVNPNGTLTVETEPNATISLITLQGALIRQIKAEGNVSQLSVDNLSAGTYILLVKGENGVKATKVVVR